MSLPFPSQHSTCLPWASNVFILLFDNYLLSSSWASLVAQLVKNLPIVWETWLPSLGWEDPQEKGKASHSSILAWRIPWTV